MMTKLNVLCISLVFSFISGRSQDSLGSYYSVTHQSSRALNRTKENVELDFYLVSKSPLRDTVYTYFISGADTLIVKSNQDGKTICQIPDGSYKITICHELIEPFVISKFNVQTHRFYSFEFYLKPRTIRLPEMRYDLGKPVLYAYSDKPVNHIQLRIKTPGELYFTYPTYDTLWNFSIDTNQLLKVADKNYPYLFWDAKFDHVQNYFDKGSGFTVSTNELITFFDSLFCSIGFSATERTDFITFWCPSMLEYESVDLFFLVNEFCDDLAQLQISPSPDNLYRLYMIWQPAVSTRKLMPQILPAVQRNNFYLIEWGAMRYLDHPEN